MALVLGTNCGFVTVAPTSDPSGNTFVANNRAMTFKVTAPTGAAKVVEIGWWCDSATEAADTEVGLYDHNVGDDEAENLLGTSGAFAKGTNAGWKVATGLDIEITEGTIYWLAFQLDNTATITYMNYGGAGDPWEYKLGTQTTLTDPWGTSDGSNNLLAGIYAVWEEAAGGTNMQINIGDAWKEVPAMKINIGDVWKDVASAKINIGDAWKTIF